MRCQAKRQVDEMHCHRCQLLWDVKDPEPPQCEDYGVIDGDIQYSTGNKSRDQIITRSDK